VLAIGDAVRLSVTGPCPRCVMTTLPQGDLPKDTGILRTAAEHNRANVGVYASVLQSGRSAVVIPSEWSKGQQLTSRGQQLLLWHSYFQLAVKSCVEVFTTIIGSSGDFFSNDVQLGSQVSK
jgi:hypothetical protein